MKLTQSLTNLRERIRQRVEGQVEGIPDFRPPSLDELEKRRQHAANWAAVVGAVNPRPERWHDRLIQGGKRLIARSLRWYAHPQQVLNQAQLDTTAEIQQLLADHNRNLTVLAQAVAQAQQTASEALECVENAVAEVRDLRAAMPGDQSERVQAAESKIDATRQNLERELREQRRSLDDHMVSNLAEVRAKVDSLEYHLVQNVKELNDSLNYVQKKFWEDMERWQKEHQDRHLEQAGTLGQELRLIRQRLRAGADVASDRAATEARRNVASDRAATEARRVLGGVRDGAVPGATDNQTSEGQTVHSPAAPAPAAGNPDGYPSGWTPALHKLPPFDYARFEERFRGMEPEVRDRQALYLPLFRGRAPVLDVACGRGEFLTFLRENGIEARGIDLDTDMVARCRQQDLDVVCADAFAFLEQLADDSLGALFSAQFIEHLPTGRYVRLIELAFRKLKKRGMLLLETQNPQCLVTLSQNFYLDPTHVTPIPTGQLQFWMEETGFSELSTYYVSPVEPALPVLPVFRDTAGIAALEQWNAEAARFNKIYFGGQDYAVAGIKP